MKRKPGRPRTMSEILRNKKSLMENLDASPTQLQSEAPILQQPSQQLQPPSQQLQPPPQDTQYRKPGRPRTMSEILRSKKSRMENLDASPTLLPFETPILQQSSQQLQPPSQPLQPPSQDTQVIRKRKVGCQPQQQQVSTQHTTTHPPSHPSSSTPAQASPMSNSCGTGSGTSKKGGRGKSLGIKGWGSGIKLKFQFDENYIPMEAEGKSLNGQLGVMVRNSYRVPLTYVDWNSIPGDIKEDIWKEVKDNLEDCPDEFKSVCMDTCRRIYKDNKSKIKNDHFKPYMVPNADPNIAIKCPDFVDPDQWIELVEYWKDQDVAAKALLNSQNRGQRGPPHNTGRTAFSQIRRDIAAKGGSLDKMSVYLQTRRKDDPEVIKIVEAFNQQLELLNEDERTIEARDRIFHSIVGKDDHGYCRTYGGSVPRSSVYNNNSGPSQTSKPSSMAEMEQRIENRVTQQVTRQVLAELGLELGSEARQFPDAASGLRSVRESIGDDMSPLEQRHRTPIHSPRTDEQLIREVYLQTSGIPKCDVGEGLLITSNVAAEVDGEPLGEGYCKVYVGKAINPNVRLERPRAFVETVGDALGRYVAWRFCDVIEKEMDDY